MEHALHRLKRNRTESSAVVNKSKTNAIPANDSTAGLTSHDRFTRQAALPLLSGSMPRRSC